MSIPYLASKSTHTHSPLGICQALASNCALSHVIPKNCRIIKIPIILLPTWDLYAVTPNDFALDGLIQVPVALDRVDPDFPLCRDGEDFNAVEHGTSDPGQLADDLDIIGPEPIQYSRDLSVAPGRSAGCRFLDKLDTTEIGPNYAKVPKRP